MDEERLEYLGQVALWYYEENLDQREIARRLGKSRSMVSRLLTEARAAGLVDVRVRFPLRADEAAGRDFAEAFGLDSAVVLANSSPDHSLMMRRLGRLGARSLQAHLQPGITVAIGWGAALQSVVWAMPEIEIRDSMVLQFLGSVSGSEPGLDGALLARTLASKLGGDFQAVPAPLIVENAGIAESLKADRGVRRTLDAAAGADVFITGIGTIESPLSGLARAGYFSKEDFTRMRSMGVVGDVMGYLINLDGEIVNAPENQRVIALAIDELRESRTVIGVAGGAVKAPAITGALRTGVFNEMVIDLAAATAVMDIHAGRLDPAVWRSQDRFDARVRAGGL